MVSIIIMLTLFVAILAFIEQPRYTVEEDAGTVEVCVVLEGLLETEVILNFITQDDSATGIYYLLCSLLKYLF